MQEKMTCKFCTRRQFLKICTAAAGTVGLGGIPNIFAGTPPKLNINITARCIFSSIVVTHEVQKNFPNPYKKDTNYHFTMNDDCSGISQGINAVRSGKADIGTLCRSLTNEEKSAGLVETTLDSLGYSIIVNKKNSVNELTREQVLKIFAGQIQNWKEVGGRDAAILIYRQKCGANYDYLIDQAITQAGIEKNPARLKEAVMNVDITDNQFEKIAALDMAITMAPRFFFDANSKALKIDGVLPTRKSEKNGTYPFLASISLVSRENASQAGQAYLSFMTGAHGKKLIEDGLNMNWLRDGF